jgi:hypothetical protein
MVTKQSGQIVLFKFPQTDLTIDIASMINQSQTEFSALD